MKFEELQKQWQAVQSKPRSHDELRKMMYPSPWSRIKKISVREALGFSVKASIILGVILVFDLFESWSSGIFAAWAIFAFLDEYLGLRYLRIMPQQGTIEQSLEMALLRIRKVILFTRLGHLLIYVTLVLMLGMNVPVGSMNILLWALMLAPLLAAVIWWSARKWSYKINEVKELLKAFDDGQSMPAGL